MLRRWLARLIGPKPPGFQYRVLVDKACGLDHTMYLCMLCDDYVRQDQLKFHAEKLHGFDASNVRISTPHRHTASCE